LNERAALIVSCLHLKLSDETKRQSVVPLRLYVKHHMTFLMQFPQQHQQTLLVNRLEQRLGSPIPNLISRKKLE